jgi:hypothetical protein
MPGALRALYASINTRGFVPTSKKSTHIVAVRRPLSDGCNRAFSNAIVQLLNTLLFVAEQLTEAAQAEVQAAREKKSAERRAKNDSTLASELEHLADQAFHEAGTVCVEPGGEDQVSHSAARDKLLKAYFGEALKTARLVHPGTMLSPADPRRGGGTSEGGSRSERLRAPQKALELPAELRLPHTVELRSPQSPAARSAGTPLPTNIHGRRCMPGTCYPPPWRKSPPVRAHVRGVLPDMGI